MEKHSFRRVSDSSRKLCLSTKFPHQEIKWNFGILRNLAPGKSQIFFPERIVKDFI